VTEFRIGEDPILSGSIVLPRAGVWHADLVVDAEEPPTGDVVITIATGDEEVTLTGTAHRKGAFQGRTELRVVGGKNGLRQDVEARYYTDAQVRTILGDLLRDAGETLSGESSSTVQDVTFNRWVRRNAPARAALDLLCRATGATWRVLTSGEVWVGTEDWPAVDFDHDVMRDWPAEGRLEIATDAYPGELLPGTTFLERRVGYVEHVITPDRTRTTVWFEDDRRNDAAAMLDRFVRMVVAPMDFFPMFPATVSSQADDLTLEVTPDSDRLPGMTKVPIRTFLPGASIKVKKDCRVLVGFEAGDPSRPVAYLFEGDASKLKELTIETADGAKAVLKEGGSIRLIPKAGEKVLLGAESGTQPIPMGTDLNSYLADMKAAINNNRSDINTIKDHTHTFVGSGTVQSSPQLTSLPSASTVGDPPDLAESAEAG
jgi:hypothetical protein